MPSITAADHRGLTLLHRLVFGGLAEPLPRLRPVVVGRPHPKRRLRRWGIGRVLRGRETSVPSEG